MADSPPDFRVLDEIAIESPCQVPWDEIRGKHRVRYCGSCRKQVYDVIEMTTAEAVGIVVTDGALPCIRICRDPDGRILTADNPTGVRAKIWRNLRRHSGWAASLFAFFLMPGCGWLSSSFTAGTVKSINLPQSPAQESAPAGVDTSKSPLSTD